MIKKIRLRHFNEIGDCMKSCDTKYISSYNRFCLSSLLMLACSFTSIETTYSIKELKEKPEILTEVITTLLTEHGYSVTNNVMEIYNKSSLIIIVADTSAGKKFLKLHENGGGIREHNGGEFISQYLPTIASECVICKNNLELVVQPHIEAAGERSLFNFLENPSTREDESLSFVATIINDIAALAHRTLEYTIKPAVNDYLYNHRLKTKEKDGESGRVESFYAQKKLNLAGVEIEWEELLAKKFIIDGVEYQETLHDLLALAKKYVDPKRPRLMAISHGDFQEMNMYLEDVTSKNPAFHFIDCEYSGVNDVIGDAVLSIIHLAVLTAYLRPKYHPTLFRDIPGLKEVQKHFDSMKRQIAVSNKEEFIMFDGINRFGTSGRRKKIVNLLINSYLDPLLQSTKKQFPIDDIEIENKIKSHIIMRLIGVDNVGLMEPMDQAKVLCLLFKAVATPVNTNTNIRIKTLTNLENAI